MFQQDFMKRQIEAIGKTFAAMLFGKKNLSRMLENEDEDEESQGFESDILKTLLDHALSTYNIKEGQKAIFEAVEKSKSKTNLILALNFYNGVLKLDEEVLKKNNFSKQEAEADIKKLSEVYAQDSSK